MRVTITSGVTRIPVVATRLNHVSPERGAKVAVYLQVVATGRGEVSPSKWGLNSRKHKVLFRGHQSIIENWNSLKDGQEIGVSLYRLRTQTPSPC